MSRLGPFGTNKINFIYWIWGRKCKFRESVGPENKEIVISILLCFKQNCPAFQNPIHALVEVVHDHIRRGKLYKQ